MIFDSVEDLARHRDEVHPGQIIYVCTACEKTFSDYHEATEHVLWKHDVYCDECQQSYLYEAISLSSDMKNRISEIHTKMGELREELDQLTTIQRSEVKQT